MPLQNKVVLVSGGGGGIGATICATFAQAGAAVVLTYNSDEAKAQRVLESLPGTNHMLVQARVEDSATLTQLVHAVRERYHRLDVLVNNAGITVPVPHADLHALDDALIDRIFQVNWRGAFAMIRAFQSLLAESDGGLVVNISSVAGQTGMGSNVAYCASKAALDSMTRSLARALAPAIRVVSVSPGWVEGEYAQRFSSDMIQAQRNATPLGRIATAQDVADATLAAATLLRFTTGAIIPVDGGRPLGTA